MPGRRIDKKKESIFEALLSVLEENNIENTPRESSVDFAVVQRAFFLWKETPWRLVEKETQKLYLRVLKHWKKRRKKRGKSPQIDDAIFEKTKVDLSAKLVLSRKQALENLEKSKSDQKQRTRGRPRIVEKEIAMEALWSILPPTAKQRPRKSDKSFEAVIKAVNHWKGTNWWEKADETSRNHVMREVSKWFTKRRKADDAHSLCQGKEFCLLKSQLRLCMGEVFSRKRSFSDLGFLSAESPKVDGNVCPAQVMPAEKRAKNTLIPMCPCADSTARKIIHYVPGENKPHVDFVEKDSVHCPHLYKTQGAHVKNYASEENGSPIQHVLHCIPGEEIPHIDMVSDDGSIYCEHISLLCDEDGCDSSCLPMGDFGDFRALDSFELGEALDSICIESLMRLAPSPSSSSSSSSSSTTTTTSCSSAPCSSHVCNDS